MSHTPGFDIGDLWFISDPSIFNEQTDQKELNYQLVSQLLEIERVTLNAKMIPFLTNPGVCETIISFITRVPEGELDESSQNYAREREINEAALKKSYNAVYLILNRSNSGMKTFISNSPNQYLQLLLRAFLPQSNAYFNHIKLIFAWSIENFVEFKKLLFKSDFVLLGLNYLHETPVIELLLAIISSTISYPDERERLKSLDIFSMIAARITDKDNIESSKNASEFFSRLVHEISITGSGDELLHSLYQSSSLVDQLFEPLLAEEFPIQVQKSSLFAFWSLYSKIHEKPVSQPGYMESHNSLINLKDKINSYLSSYVPQLCTILIKSRNPKLFTFDSFQLPSYSVKSSLGSFRLQLIEIITQNLENDNSVLPNIPDQFWNSIVAWYFENCNNSTYLIKFSRIFQVALFSNNEDVFKKVVSKTKFISKMIDSFYAPEYSACKIFTLLICNQLRLYAESNPTGHVKHYLTSHGSWAPFVPTLRNETEHLCAKSQISIRSQVPINLPPRLYSPTTTKSYTGEGIDLGSPYAHSIGIDTEPSEVVLPPPSLKKKKKRKSSVTNLQKPENEENNNNNDNNNNNNGNEENAKTQ